MCLPVFVIGCIAFIVSARWAAGADQLATVLASELNLRAGPGLHHPILASLPEGTRVRVLSYEGEWVRIRCGDKSGFVLNQSRYLRIDNGSGEAGGTSAVHRNADLERQLQTSKQKVASYSKEEAGIVNMLDDTEKALDQARKTVTRLSAELNAVEQQIRTIEGQYREVEARAENAETYVAGRLAALYKLSWLGKFHVLAAADSMFDFFTRRRALQQILARDAQIMDQLADDKSRMQALLDQLMVRKNEKQATTADLSAKIETMHARQAERERLLTQIRSEKSLQLAAIASLEASAQELDRTVAAFKPPAAESPSLSDAAEKPFAALKGLLMMPVNGKVISFFGQYTDRKINVTNFQSGINIKADRGEPIRAVHGGQTLFSSWFKGFGNMIIIDHGDHYYTVYAHLEELFKSKGDPVETGEVIATVGDSGSLHGAGLHFEIRHHGKPINPLGWIKKG
ncbi:peptidase M23 [Desulfosarcina ovata subsp. sediminis]|uniref:Peptidase M23 n=1 Tax=Desulfosarcina ovata subsp. sediminis TaxID=885957 RepID=A0A5K7ZTI1_9BACT|nr:peptidoglycan DD-metalloendopeptidase family protein [Desulfosarcina ovata]BBO83515.1 peptidase M23 [Desulfosarcina ovata subsp. sediminis]